MHNLWHEAIRIVASAAFVRLVTTACSWASSMRAATTRHIINGTILAALLMSNGILFLFGTPVKIGFSCFDPSIKHPFAKGTVSEAQVAVANVVILVAILVVELVFVVKPRRLRSRLAMRAVSTLLTTFFFGAATTMLMTQIFKFYLGRLRPHFWQVCDVDKDSIDCGTPLDPLFVSNYTCPGNADLFSDYEERMARVEDAHASFVSGHTSMAFHLAFFLMYYLRARRQQLLPQTLFVPAIQFMAFASACYVGITRVTDNYHHPEDVFSGAVEGAAFAWTACATLLATDGENLDENEVDTDEEEAGERHDAVFIVEQQ
jgi:phosphatidate phosphatase